MLLRPSFSVTVTRAGRSRGASALIAGSSATLHALAQRGDGGIGERGIVDVAVARASSHDHHGGGVRQRILRREVVRRIRVAHDRGEAIGRELDALDLVGPRPQFRKRIACRQSSAGWIGLQQA